MTQRKIKKLRLNYRAVWPKGLTVLLEDKSFLYLRFLCTSCKLTVLQKVQCYEGSLLKIMVAFKYE